MTFSTLFHLLHTQAAVPVQSCLGLFPLQIFWLACALQKLKSHNASQCLKVILQQLPVSLFFSSLFGPQTFSQVPEFRSNLSLQLPFPCANHREQILLSYDWYVVCRKAKWVSKAPASLLRTLLGWYNQPPSGALLYRGTCGSATEIFLSLQVLGPTRQR